MKKIDHNIIARVFKNSPYPTVVIDSNGFIVSCNSAVETLTGYSKTEIEAEPSFYSFCTRILSDVRDHDILDVLRSILDSGNFGERRRAIVVSSQNGEKRLADCILYELPSRGNQTAYYVIQAIDITKKKEVEGGLKLLTSAIAQSTEGIALFDLDGNILFVNDAYSAMHGYSPAELHGKHISIFHTTRQISNVENSMKLVRKTGEFKGEIGHVRNNGVEFPTMTHTTLLRDEAGNPSGYIATSQDITESKRNEIQSNALRRIRNHVLTMNGFDGVLYLMKLISNCLKTVGIPYKNAEVHVITSFSPTFNVRSFRITGDVKLYEYSKETSIKNIYNFWESGVPVYRRDLDAEDLYNERQDITKYWGHIRSILDIPFSHGTLAVNSPEPNAFQQSDIIFLRELAQILSEGFQRAEDQQKLAFSESLYRSLVETPTNVIVVRLQTDGRLVYLSPQIRHLTGYDVESFYNGGEIYKKLIHPDDLPLIIKIMKRAFAGETVKNHEFRWLNRTGEWNWAQKTTFPVYDGDGHVASVQLVIHDITERKRAEEALHESEAKNRAILDAIPDTVFLITTDGTIIDYKGNPNDILLDHKPIIGEKIFHILPESVASSALFRIERTLNEGVQVFEYTLPVKGFLRTFEARMVKNTEGEVITIIRDITDRKHREDQRNALQHLRREVLNMRGVNDINTVMSVLKNVLKEAGINFRDGGINFIENVENLSIISHPLSRDKHWRYDIIPKAANIIFKFWSNGEPVYRRDITKNDIYEERQHIIDLWGEVRSVIDIPFSHGTVALNSSEPDAFSNDDILFLQDVSQILSEGFRRAEDLQQLALSEERYRTLVETPTNQVVILLNPKNELVYISPQIELLIGYSPEELSADPMLFYKFFTSRDRRKYRNAFASATTEKKSTHYEARFNHRNGSRLWVTIDSIPIIGKSLEVEAIQFIIHNITDLKKAEQALRESEERYQHLYDYSPDIYFTIANDGSIVSINHFGLKYLGYKRNDLIGRKLWTLAYAEEYDNVKKKISDIFNQKIMNMELECRVQKKDGTVSWVQERTNLILSEDGEPSELRIACRDITDRIEAQEQIRKSLEEKEILLKEIHHRVKNNMQVISSLLSLQKERITDEHFSSMFRESINRIQTMALIHELLYRSENFSQIDFREYISRIGTYLFNLYVSQTGGVKLNIDVEEIFLKLDIAIPCGLVINELITNAFKYAFNPSIQGCVDVSMKKNGEDTIALTVADNGSGMPEGFDLEKTDTLGLKMVKLLVDYQLGGTISMKNGKGTTFEIEFGL